MDGGAAADKPALFLGFSAGGAVWGPANSVGTRRLEPTGTPAPSEACGSKIGLVEVNRVAGVARMVAGGLEPPTLGL